MKRTQSENGWTLNQALAAKYAAEAGLDPELGAQAGEAAWDTLSALSRAVAETNPERQARLIDLALRRLAHAGLSGHPELVQCVKQCAADIKGKSQPSESPHTGLQEFSVECVDEGGCRQHPTGIEVFPVTGIRPPPPPPPPPFIVGPPTLPIQPIIGPPPLPPASAIQDPPGLYSNDYEIEEITVVPNPDAETSALEYLLGGEDPEVIENWSNEKIINRIRTVKPFTTGLRNAGEGLLVDGRGYSGGIVNLLSSRQ